MAPALRTPVFGLAAFVVASLGFVGFTTLTGMGKSEAPAIAAPAQTAREVRFFDRDDGGVTVRDADGGAVVAEFEPATNGFLRSTVRGLVRERKRREIGPETPFRVSLEADGRLLLTDPATSRMVDLRAFGPSNLGVFARLLPESPASTALVANAAAMAAALR
jgi:putative photosynthetic complex assembly protein